MTIYLNRMLRLRTRGVIPQYPTYINVLNTENFLPLEILLVLSQIRKKKIFHLFLSPFSLRNFGTQNFINHPRGF
jgi:hypothetical protein